MQSRNNISLTLTALTLLLLLTMTFCSENTPQVSAPPGDKVALEKLADAYRKYSDGLPSSPANLRPEARKKFIKRVFSTAGYSYQATLSALSTVQKPEFSQHHKDLQELLFLPHHNNRLQDLPDLYSGQEIVAIEAIIKNTQ